MTAIVQTTSLTAALRDVIALTKPRITMMVLITAAGGMYLAPGSIAPAKIAIMLLTTAMVVGAANALNCYLERDIDRLMTRTAARPLPAGRLNPSVALVLGVAMGVVAVPLLTLMVNPLTGALGLLALLSYVAMYTPMKQVTPTALLVGALPGALPPLMGWTAATGSLDLPGILLFAILFLWQVPHFIAISVFRQSEYERAGLKVLPSVIGMQGAKHYAIAYAGLLVPTSLALFLLGVAGPIYLLTAIVLGSVFFVVALRGLEAESDDRWAKELFVTSLVYLTALFAVLMFDAV